MRRDWTTDESFVRTITPASAAQAAPATAAPNTPELSSESSDPEIIELDDTQAWPTIPFPDGWWAS